MALTELQLPTKQNLYGSLQSAANKINSLMHQWADIAEFIGFMGTVDLDAINIPADVRTDLVQFRTVMDELLAFYNGTATTQTHIPAEVVDKIRSM